ncbi:MAG: hypothetical protein ACHQK8_07955, partial [Bacteroidia bacterium]
MKKEFIIFFFILFILSCKKPDNNNNNGQAIACTDGILVYHQYLKAFPVIYTFTFDANKRVTATTEGHRYYYDNSNNLIRTDVCNNNGVVTSHYNYYYDSNNRL